MNKEEYILSENINEKKINCTFKIAIVIFLVVVITLIMVILLAFLILNKKDMKHMNDINNINDNIDDIDSPISLKNKVWDGYETNIGAHYYAYSPYSTHYNKVRGLIQLPDSINTNFGRRNAYISFGILGINGGVNIGLINAGTGWRPFYYLIKTQKMLCYNEYCSNEETKFIEIEIEVTQERKLLASFTFRNSTLFPLKNLHFEIDASDILEYENDKVKARFFRFASLVPLEEDDQNDGTFVNNGKITQLSIVKNNETEFWGISGNNIEVSWLISPKRIKIDFTESEEKFSIIHRNNSF